MNMFDTPDDIGSTLYDDDVSGVLAQLKARNLPDNPIAFYGSSSFRLWRSMSTDLDSLRVVNLGFGGGTFASAIYYLDRLLVPLNPKKIVLYFGENDISIDGLTAKSTMQGFETLIAAIVEKLPDVEVFFLSVKQSPQKWMYANPVFELNKLAKQYCHSAPNVNFIDVCSALIGENELPASKYYQSDLIHLNQNGYSRWSSILRNYDGLLE